MAPLLDLILPVSPSAGTDLRLSISSQINTNDYKHVGILSPRSRLLQEGALFEEQIEKVRWKVLDFMLGTMMGQLLSLLICAALLLGFGCLVWCLGGGNGSWDTSFSQSMWFSWGMFFDPGTQMSIESSETWQVKVIAVTFSVLGFTFNLLMLGLIVDLVRNLLEYWRRKRSRIVANGHTLLLGWTEKTLFVMDEIIQSAANRNIKPNMVILANDDAFDLKQRINRHFINTKELGTIQVRSGSPCDVEDLSRVSATSAKEIIILSPAERPRQADLTTLRTVVALAALRDGVKGNVVAEVRQAETSPAVTALMENAEGIFARDAVNRVLCLMAVQPVMGDMYRQLMSWCDGFELYSKTLATLQCSHAKTFGEVFNSVVGGVVLGIRKPNEHAFMSPPSNCLVGPEDKVIVLALSDTDIRARRRYTKARTWTSFKMMPQDTSVRATCSSHTTDCMVATQEHIDSERTPVFIVIGWPEDMEEMLVAMDDYVPKGTEVHILARISEDERRQRLRNNRASRDLKNVVLMHKQGSLSGLHCLADLPITRASSILILSDDGGGEDAETADSSSLATAISLSGLLAGKFPKILSIPEEGLPRQPRIVCEVLTPMLERVLKSHDLRKRVTFFHSCAVETGLFTMASAQASVYNALLMLLQPNDFGQIQMRKATDYVGQDGKDSIVFSDMSRAVRAADDILIGFCRTGQPIIINPDDPDCREMPMDAKLIVLTRTLQAPDSSLQEKIARCVDMGVDKVKDGFEHVMEYEVRKGV